MSKIRLYISTALHMKPSQIAFRIWRRVGGKTRLRYGYVPRPDVSRADVARVPVLPELDFDPAFLYRFDVDAILEDRVDLLHYEEKIDWSRSWYDRLSVPLWRFNLHYHEFLLPLAKAYLDTSDDRYLDKAKTIVANWINACPCDKGGVAWDPYVISMRIVSWLAFYGELAEKLDHDANFIARLNSSLAKQYVYLSKHLEKDLLANHYLENLKALVILACYFDDAGTLDIAVPKLLEQVEEQILPDGMHFELSPMYHKIVLEDLMRVASCLEKRGCAKWELVGRFRLQDMCDCLYSLERNTNRTPLFNDSGDNVSKSGDALLGCALNLFDLKPSFKSDLESSGYRIIEREAGVGLVKIIFDAGMPGPEYALGHAHCDALSLEAFIDGEPVIVNCGTYAYQDERRLDLKRTAAHSAPQARDVEQSECWASFRMGRRASCVGRRVGRYTVKGSMIDQSGNRLTRTVHIEADGIVEIEDETDSGSGLVSRLHLLEFDDETADKTSSLYCPEFGKELRATCFREEGECTITTVIDLAARTIIRANKSR